MKIQFISHAGFVVKTNGVSIFVDPWTTGKTFNNGWALLSPAGKVNYDEIDYIFVSHEHPDHFNFPTLNSIGLENRSRIKILYQKHASSRLKDAFIKLKFSEVIELPIYDWFRLGEIDLFCVSAG
jgi:UDP-MurNAc hydroxylase